MQNYVFIVTVCFLFPGLAHAQECGKVVDLETGEPVVGAHIYLDDEELMAITDTEGQFCLPVTVKVKRATRLSFSHVGYEKTELSWKQFKDKEAVVELQFAPHTLGEVTISGRELYFILPYEKRAPLRMPLSSFGATQVGNYIYVVGGDASYRKSNFSAAIRTLSGSQTTLAPAQYNGYSSSMYRYDIANDEWEKMPVRFRNRAYHAVSNYEDKLYIVGGKRLSTNRRLEYLDHTVEIYDLKKDTLLTDPVNPHQAINFASCLYEDNLILLGGSVRKTRSGKKNYTNKVHAFNLKTGLWYEMASLPEARETQGIQVGDKFYLIGGYQDRVLDRIDSYSLTEGVVSQEGKLSYKVKRPALATDGEVIYIFEDGIMQTYNVNTREQFIYQANIYVHNSEMFCADGKLYILGGYSVDENSQEPYRDMYSIDLKAMAQTRQYYSKK